MNGREGRDCSQEEGKALGTWVLNSAQPFVPETSLESELQQLSLTPHLPPTLSFSAILVLLPYSFQTFSKVTDELQGKF